MITSGWNCLGGSGFIVDQMLSVTDAGSVFTFECRYDVRAYHDALFSRLGVDFPPTLERAVAKRRAEYLAGRHAARSALRALGCVPSQVTATEDRAPLWPHGVIGSISHTSDLAMCSVALRTHLFALGIDTEKEIAPDMAREIAASIIGPAEQRYLGCLPLTLEHGVTLALSAKESLYKALYPHVGRFFDFSAAQLIEVDTETLSLALILTEDWSAQWRLGSVVTGTYSCTVDGVNTRVAIT
jgi:enterobactin synthetase component D